MADLSVRYPIPSSISIHTPLVNWKTKNNDCFFSLDCDDVLRQQTSFVSQGIFRIKPRLSTESFDVLCLLENNTIWTVLQRRLNGSVDFYRGWNDYKHGFGDLNSEFWLGNEKIHQLTNQGPYV